MAVRILRIELRRTTAIVQIDIDLRKYTVIECSNSHFCKSFGILDGDCPAYCEIIVAAKDYIYGRRKPKAYVVELEQDLIRV